LETWLVRADPYHIAFSPGSAHRLRSNVDLRHGFNRFRGEYYFHGLAGLLIAYFV